MNNRGVRFLHLANWLVAVFLAFVLIVQWDEESPLPVQASLTVMAWDGSTTLTELRSETEAFARERGITFAQEVVDFEQRHAVRHLYLVDGDLTVPGSDWLQGGYRDFVQSTTTQVHEFAELGNRTPIGRYDVFGDAAKADELKGFLASHGLSSHVDELGTWRNIPTSVLLALSMMVFFAMAVVSASVLAGTKTYGIGRLQGLSYGSLLLADLRMGATVWALSGAVVASGTLVVLSLYNGLAAFATLAAAVLAIDLLLTATAFAANALALLLIMQLGIQSALKGELPGRTASAMAYAMRLSAAVLTLVTMTTALQVGVDVADRKRSYDAYERLGETSALSLGNAYTLEDQERLAKVVGAWLREQDRAGNILLAGQMLLANSDPLLNGRTVLYVNDTFLSDQPVQLANGGSYAADAAGDRLDVLIPAGLWERREQVTEELGVDAILRADVRGVDYRPLEAAGGQEFFTYSTPSAVQESATPWVSEQAYATDPVIVVLPSSVGMLSDDGYTAFSSSAGLLFPGRAVVRNAVAENQELQRYVRAVVPVAEQAAVETQRLMQELRLAMSTAAIGVLVLAITGIGVVLIYTRRNSQLIFARHVSGWRFSAVHRSLIAIEMVVFAVLAGLLPYQVWSQNRELEVYKRMGAPVPADSISMTAGQWVAVALLAAVAIGGVLAALTRAHRRVIHDGASEA